MLVPTVHFCLFTQAVKPLPYFAVIIKKISLDFFVLNDVDAFLKHY